MRNLLLSAILGLAIFTGCTKASHTTTTKHSQRYSSFNFTFNGTTYSNSAVDTPTTVSAGNDVTELYTGDSAVSVRALFLYFAGPKYSLYLQAKKMDPIDHVGKYLIGEGYDSTTQYSFSYGSATIQGFTNRENYYYNYGDNGTSYITVTEYAPHEIKGTFVLQCAETGSSTIYPVTGDFDIIMP
ncbi:hypothetical protein CJD36_003775 [Flavipsychrobacter stenotrophus]|uniref:Lipoprotein n=1 Tax=Flavipsychrobacter stenotrophus TaxID=2077091 RepID=A0A2S7T1P4_9BACT|nr:hypothetical protein [Flavipsychrobacter stenotrophus]PQJ12874.1 hypothetical protein CJD36_003775 [Flavipsychrobacter stenotrophus]